MSLPFYPIPEFFVLISPFVQGSQSVLRINVSTQTRRMQETVGLPWGIPVIRASAFCTKCEVRFRASKGALFIFHSKTWRILDFTCIFNALEAMQKNTTLPHKAFVHSLCKRPNPVKPSGLRLQRVFCKLKGRLHCLPFCFCTVFIPRQKWLSSHRSSAQHAHNPRPRLLQTRLHAWPRQQPRSSLF